MDFVNIKEFLDIVIFWLLLIFKIIFLICLINNGLGNFLLMKLIVDIKYLKDIGINLEWDVIKVIIVWELSFLIFLVMFNFFLLLFFILILSKNNWWFFFFEMFFKSCWGFL